MSGRLVPTDFYDWGFFDRQKSLFPKFKDDFGTDFGDFDRELEKIKKEMFHLTPMDIGGGFGDFGDMGFGKDFPSGSGSFKSEFSSTTTSSSSGAGGKMKDPFAGMGMGSDFGALGSSMGSGALLKVDKPFIEDLSGNKKLNLRFDCSQFKPEEIQVRTIDRNLSVQAKHVEESPGKKVYREFSKQYTLPENVDPMKVTSALSCDGVLTIQAPAPPSVEARKERLIPIEKLMW
ncbi:hypothetical protein FSP39_025496 [Pinctada imbricata]|uniref:SHSP domain-containing protein n=2 Tax=Pinctada TaxID=50425 RepID=A0AA88YRW6_PINIB|nr:heat shock protein 22 [Pinctada fucata]KAK3104229.1 hypothetical protein FSP39_025496 [Pinctada imbricata]